MQSLLLLLIVLFSSAACIDVYAHYPFDSAGCTSLGLRGDVSPLSWTKSTSMKRIDDHTYAVTLSLPTNTSYPTYIHVKTVINRDKWQVGANEELFVPSAAAVLHVYPWYSGGHGEYVYIRHVFSPELQNTRDLVLYLPGPYLENPFFESQDILIMHDGQNLFNDSTAFAKTSWRVQDTLDPMISNGELPPVMVIGVDNTGVLL